MTDKAHITAVVNEFLGGGDLFLVSITISTQNRIRVFIDGDKGVTIDDCIRLSRHIESQLDREKEDFELEVSSVGVGQPLMLLRQYNNNLGRRLSVHASGNQYIKGKLAGVTQDGIFIEKEKPDKGKKKKKEPETDTESKQYIPFDEILEAKVRVSFK